MRLVELHLKHGGVVMVNPDHVTSVAKGEQDGTTRVSVLPHFDYLVAGAPDWVRYELEGGR